MYSSSLFILIALLLNLFVSSTNFLSVDNINWSMYIASFSNLDLNSSSYSNFRDNIDFVQKNNKYYNSNLGVTPYFHYDRTVFSLNFLHSVKYYIKAGEYFGLSNSEKEFFSKLKNGFYFNWNEKGVFPSFKEYKFHTKFLAAHVAVSLVSSILKIKYNVDINSSDKIIEVAEIIEKQRNQDGDHFSSPIHYIEYMLGHDDFLKQFTLSDTESGRLELKTDNFNIYAGPIVVELSLDPTYIQFYDGSVLHLNRLSNQANYYGLIVGYGKDKNEDYYIIKTSFSSEFGYDSCIKLRVSSTAILSRYTVNYKN